MIDLKSKQKYINFIFARRIILWIATLPTILFGVVVLLFSVIKNEQTISIPSFISIILMSIIILTNACLTLVQGLLKKKLRVEAIYQFYDIINKTKIKKLPKVVYVYTCHNDFIGARVIQNSHQTYKNVETWISDGSDSDILSNTIREFAKQNKFKYFKVSPKGSKNKADNLNHFLSSSGVKFDYLLITDSDEALHPNFVEQALKCFQSNKFRNLGFVSPLNYFYGDRSLFSAWGLNWQNVNEWMTNYTKSFSLFEMPNLFSASSLVSNELIKKNNNKFPEGCLEDYYLEHVAIITGFSGLIIPTAPCGQEFDRSLKAAIKRNMRIYDWQIYLFKKRIFDTYNEKYKSWYRMLTIVVFTPLIVLLAYIVLPWILLFFIEFFISLFTNPLFITIFVGFVLQLVALAFSLSLNRSTKKMLNKYGRWRNLFAVLYGFAIFGSMIIHFINSFFKNKYSDFTSSGSIKNHKSNIFIPILVLSLSSIMIAILISLFVIFGCLSLSKPWMMLLFIYLLILLLILFACSFSFILLSKMDKRIVNTQFNINDKVLPPPFYNFSDLIKDKVEEKHD